MRLFPIGAEAMFEQKCFAKMAEPIILELEAKKRVQGYALDPRRKEVKIKDLTFWPSGNR
jgi:hypothetical protein